jgi:hypothetical protein
LRNHVGVALLIVVPSFVLTMNRTIALDHEVGFAAVKVSNVIADLVLPPEFVAKESAIAQQLP